MGKIIVASIDADGCYLGNLASSGTQYQPTPAQIAEARRQNMLIINNLRDCVNDTEARKLILMDGSKRQDLGTDFDNAIKEGKGPGSFFPYLEDLEAYLLSLGIPVELHRFLMADLYQNLRPGTTWNSYHQLPFPIMAEIEKLSGQKNNSELKISAAQREELTRRWRDLRAQIKYDEIFSKKTPRFEDKMPIVRAQTNIIANDVVSENSEFRDDEIEYRFYDDGDREDRIFTALKTIRPEQIPHNVSIVLLKLDPVNSPGAGIQEIATIKGTGRIDREIYETIQREYPSKKRNDADGASVGKSRHTLMPGQGEDEPLLRTRRNDTSMEADSGNCPSCCSIS
jgi:hypothetical protein